MHLEQPGDVAYDGESYISAGYVKWLEVRLACFQEGTGLHALITAAAIAQNYG